MGQVLKFEIWLKDVEQAEPLLYEGERRPDCIRLADGTPWALSRFAKAKNPDRIALLYRPGYYAEYNHHQLTVNDKGKFELVELK